MKILPNFSISRILSSGDLLERIFFTFWVLCICRLVTYIPLPGINYTQFDLVLQYSSSIVLNAFAGGAYERGSIAALSISPYITASLFMHVMSIAGGFEFLIKLKKEGAYGAAEIKKYTKFLTVFLCIPLGTFILNAISSNPECIVIPKYLFNIIGLISFVGTTLFLVWIGEQISERGIGSGTSVIIYLGVLMGVPGSITQLLEFSRNGLYNFSEIFVYLLCIFFMIYFVTFIENSYRKIPLIYPRRSIGKFAAPSSNVLLPIKLNTGGIMPVIFANVLLTAMSGFFQGLNFLLKRFTVRDIEFIQVYLVEYSPYLMVILVFASSLLYCSMLFAPDDVAERLHKEGGYIVGVSPGKATAEYLENIVFKLAILAGLYLSFACSCEYLLPISYGLKIWGTSIIIIVTTSLEIASSFVSYLGDVYGDLIKNRFSKHDSELTEALIRRSKSGNVR